MNSAEDDYETMLVMYKAKRFSWSLFIGHLVIEKLLKALYAIVNEDFPPFTHSLLRLAEKCNLNLTEEQKINLASITAFNINARYDDYKRSFQKKCTPEFTKLWIDNLKETRIWIQGQIR